MMRGALAIVAALACARVAHADKPEQARADALFEQGQGDYQAGQYQAAIDLFKQAYELVRDPVYLFNIAQSYRKLLDCEAAADYYNRYLSAEPGADNKAKVQKWLSELAPCIEQRQKEHEAARRGEEAERARREDDERRQRAAAIVVAKPVETEVDSGRNLRLAGVIAGGAGAVGIVFGLVYSIKGKSARDDAAGCVAAMTCTGDELAARDATGKHDNTLAAVGYIGGGALAIGGAVLYVIGRTKVEHVLVAPAQGGAVGASVSYRFDF